MCAQMSVHVLVHRGCMNTVQESALKVDWEKNPLSHQEVEPWSAACWLNALPTELFPLLP